MSKAKSPVPEGQHTVSIHLNCKGAAQAIDFYTRAFGAKEVSRFPGPDGSIMHATMKLGDSLFFLNDEVHGRSKSPATLGGTPVTINLYVPDCDRTFRQAISAGGKETMPLEDQFWGDRYGMITDPYGHLWAIATRKEDLTPQEMAQRGQEFFQRMQHQQH